MGGHGSGNWYRWHARETVEGCKRVDVRYLQRNGLLEPGSRVSVSWKRSDKPAEDITLYPFHDCVRLSYRVRVQNQPWQDVSYVVPLERTSCHYGGKRAWFQCPGVVNGEPCGRRVAILYDGGRLFLCRHCYSLRYLSQRESPGDRAWHKTQSIRRKLGGSTRLLDPLPDKPKGMHWRTYNRLFREAHRAERIYDAAMDAQMIAMGAWILKRRGDLLSSVDDVTP